jgi:uncharacterized protein (TIRG00374 family)
LLVGVVCVVWLAITVDWADVLSALREMDYRWVLLATVLNLASVPLRAIRWRLMFRTYRPPPFGRLVRSMLIGQAVNALAPARLGDVARATLVGRGRVTYALGTLMVEVSLDLLMLAVLVVVLLTQVTLPAWWRGSGETLVITAATALLAIALLVIGRRRLADLLDRLQRRWPRRLVTRLHDAATQALEALDVLGGPALLAAIGCSVAIWITYTSVNLTLLRAISDRPSVLAALFLLAVLQLGVAVPSSPGRVGVFHYLCIQALAVFGIGDAKALSYALTLHLISVVMPLGMGGLLAWQLGVSLYPRSDGMEA